MMKLDIIVGYSGPPVKYGTVVTDTCRWTELQLTWLRRTSTGQTVSTN